MTADSQPGASSGQPTRCTLDLPAQTSYLTIIRELVALAALENRHTAGDIAKVVMAVDEACVNIIEHGYAAPGCCADPRLRLTLDVTPAQLAITIGDLAPRPFSPAAQLKIDLDSYWASGTSRGLGLVVLHHFMDRISHTYEPGRGNELLLVKYAHHADPRH